MRTRLLIAVAALSLLVAPAAAFASHGGKSKSMGGRGQVTYELEGTLSAFTAVKGSTPGSITIIVTDGNKAGRAFKGDTLTFMSHEGDEGRGERQRHDRQRRSRRDPGQGPGRPRRRRFAEADPAQG